MPLSPVQSKIFDQLIYQEKAISELYDVFSKQFSEHASFWKELSLAEARHAKLLTDLQEAADNEQIGFDTGKLTITTLNAYLSRLDEVLRKAKDGEFTLKTALSCAVDYESSLVERKIFSLFNSSDRKFNEVLKTLQSETEKHVEFIQNIQRSVSKISS